MDIKEEITKQIQEMIPEYSSYLKLNTSDTANRAFEHGELTMLRVIAININVSIPILDMLNELIDKYEIVLEHAYNGV